MADNTTLDPGAGGDTIATDDVAGVKYQRVKLVDGTADATTAVAAGGGVEAGALRVTVASDSTGVLSVDDNGASLTVDDGAGSLTVDNATISVVGGGAEATAQRVTIASDSTGVLSVDDNGGSLTVDGTVTANLAAGTNNIGDVDVLTIAAGTNAIGNVGLVGRTTGGLTTFHLVSAASTNATSVKASAGQLFGWYIYNSNAAARKVAFHNTAGTPTAGSSVFFSLVIPPTSGANVFSDVGIAFSTGIGITAVTDLTDAGATAVAANDLIINLWYA